MSIIGIQINDTRQQILKQMEDSDFNFHLTGSRYFGVDHPDSDWDFMVGDSKEICKFLGSLGFRCSQHEMPYTYKDDNCLWIYRHPCGIDVQLSKHIRARLFARNVLAWNGFWREQLKNSDKANRRFIWNELFKLYFAAEDVMKEDRI